MLICLPQLFSNGKQNCKAIQAVKHYCPSVQLWFWNLFTVPFQAEGKCHCIIREVKDKIKDKLDCGLVNILIQYNQVSKKRSLAPTLYPLFVGTTPGLCLGEHFCRHPEEQIKEQIPENQPVRQRHFFSHEFSARAQTSGPG